MKKILTRVLSACIALTMLCACTTTTTEVDNNSEEEYLVILDAYSLHENASIKITESTGEILETGGIEFVIDTNKTLSEIVKDSGYEEFEPYCEYDTFEGWVIYNIEITPTEDGFSDYEYALVSDKLYTTKEVAEMKFDAGKHYALTAKWEGISLDEYYTNEDIDTSLDGYTGVIGMSSNGGTLVYSQDGDEYYTTESSVVGFMEDENSLAESYANSSYCIDAIKDGQTLKGWTVYKADALQLNEEESDDALYFGKIDDTMYYATMTNGELVNENMSTEDLNKLEPGNQIYLAIANWE